jgi:hypothetical protein
MSPMSFQGVGVKRSYRGVRSHLIYQHQSPYVQRGPHHLPGGSQPFVSFTRTHASLFRVYPRRLIIRQMVDLLSLTPSSR